MRLAVECRSKFFRVVKGPVDTPLTRTMCAELCLPFQKPGVVFLAMHLCVGQKEQLLEGVVLQAWHGEIVMPVDENKV